MSTITKMPTKSELPKPATNRPEDRELKNDRPLVLIALLAVLALISLIIWLASISPVPETSDYFYSMP